MTVLEQVSHETMIFMRGKYRLDEIGNGKDELKFKQGKKTILTIYIHGDRFTFLIIFGKKEREYFEIHQNDFSKYIQDHYNSSKTFHDGKWMYMDVCTPEQLEEIKKLIQIKKAPNRKPFPKENAVYSKCGQRCDLCVHYRNTEEGLRAIMEPQLNKMWGVTDWSMRCGGCRSESCYCKDEPCHAKVCMAQKGLSECKECSEFPCIQATTADYRSMIHTEVHYADEITWGILPYVPMQYEKNMEHNMVDSRCGLHCTGCEYKETCGCGGCIETNGHPFHGECPVAVCCQDKGIAHCGECPDIPCELLTQYSCNPEHGDTPWGARIEQCRRWYAESKGER